MQVIRAFRVHAFVDDKLFPLFFLRKGMGAVRASERVWLRKPVLFRGECRRAYLAQDLPFGAVILVQVWLRGIAARACASVRDITFLAACDRLELFTVAPFKVRDVFPVVPFFVKDDLRELIGFKLLVFRGMGIVMRPLFERYISADKQDEPAVHLIKVLNYI